MGVDLTTGEFNVALSPFWHKIASRGALKIRSLDPKPTAITKSLIE